MVSYLSPSLRVFLFLPTISLSLPHSLSAPLPRPFRRSSLPDYLILRPSSLTFLYQTSAPFLYLCLFLPFLAFRSSSPPAYLILPFFSSFSLFLYLTPLVSRPLFRSPPMTESLEQATLKREKHFVLRPKCRILAPLRVLF